MSKLAAGAIHKFLTGETVTGDDTQIATNINIAFELLRQAGNDTDDKVTAANTNLSSNYYTKPQTDAALGVRDANLTDFKNETATNFGVRDTAIAQLSIGQIPPAPNTPPVPISLGNGLQVVNVGINSPYNVLNIVGRTLVNLLGRDGNCEDTSKWTTSQASIVLDTTNKTVGSNGITATISATFTSGAMQSTAKAISNTKYYLLAADTKRIDSTSVALVALKVSNGGLIKSQSNSLTSFVTNFVTLSPTDLGSETAIYAFFQVSGAAGQKGSIDGVRLYEITAAEKTYIDGLSVAAAQAYIAAKYPYCDDVKHVNAPYVIKYGENLLPTFNEWTLHANAVVIDPYKLTLNATANAQTSYIDILCLPSTQYTFSLTHNAKMDIRLRDSANALISSLGFSSAQTVTFTTTSATYYIRVVVENDTLGAGTYTFTNPMLNLGATAKPFKPRNDDSLFFPNVQLASSVDGTVYDQIYKVDGKYRRENRFVRDMVLDGNLTWVFDNDYAGFKRVRFGYSSLSQDPSLPLSASSVITKYNGTIINTNGGSGASDKFDWDTGGKWFFISIADTDSGWGESYTPTTQEIQAYFYGWRMYDGTIGVNTPYNGTGSKAWGRRRYDGVIIDGSATLPTTDGFGVSGGVYKPYKLTYQLATPTFEEIQVDAGMSLHEGLNQIEVGQGVVVREKANPYSDGSFARINSNAGGGSVNTWLKNKTGRILSVYKNGKIDNSWTISTGVSAQIYGTCNAFTPTANYDPTAIYEVSYIALDQYLLSAPVQAVSGEVASNLKTVVDTLSANQADQDARISANELLARQVYNTVQKTTAALNLYVDGTNGADNNDGSAGKPFKTIQRAINSIPKDTDHNNKIFIADGTYSEDVFINGFMGGGEIRLIGNSAAMTNVKINSIQVMRNTAYINLSYLQVIGETPVASGALFVYGCTNVVITSVTTTNAGQYGLNVMRCFATVDSCTFSNKTVAGLFVQNATIVSANNGGTSNAVGLLSTIGAFVGKSGTQPTGTVIESTNSGGMIVSSSGVLNPWGDNTYANRSSVQAATIATTTLTNTSTWYKIAFGSKANDNLSEFDSTTTYTFTAKHAGLYNILTSIEFTNLVAGDREFIGLYKNGALWCFVGDLHYTNTVSAYVTGGVNILLNAGDTLSLYAYSAAGASGKIIASNTQTSYMHIIQIA